MLDNLSTKPAKRGRKALPAATPQTQQSQNALPLGWPRFTPRTTLEEIEARLKALNQHFNEERYAIYKDLLNQFCTIHTPRLSSMTIVCSSVSDAIFHMIDDCVTSSSEAPLRYNNPCTLVRDVKAMLEASQG